MNGAKSKPEFLYVIHIEAPRARVWEALTDGKQTRHFWYGRSVGSDWTKGARVEFRMADSNRLDHDGEILEIDPPNRLVMTFDTRPQGSTEPPSRVTYELEEKNGATKLTVTHDRFPPDSKVLEGVSNGWPTILSSMKTYLELGHPLVETTTWNGCHDAA